MQKNRFVIPEMSRKEFGNPPENTENYILRYFFMYFLWYFNIISDEFDARIFKKWCPNHPRNVNGSERMALA